MKKINFLTDGWGVISRWTLFYAVRLCHLLFRRRQIRSAREYVRLCRRLYPAVFGYEVVDGRLVGTAWNFLSPRVWAIEFSSFKKYWDACAGRPNIIGSDFNPDPQMTFGAWQAGIPASVLKNLIRARKADVILNEQIIGLLKGSRPRLIGAARAARRHSAMSSRLLFSSRALIKLGQLCPELQSVAIDYFRDSHPGDTLMRARDIEWAAVAAAQKQLVADKSGRVRAAMSQRQMDKDVSSRRALRIFGIEDQLELAEKLSPSYPKIPIEYSIGLALGASPSQLSGGVLNRKEAHKWLEEGAPEIVPFLGRNLSQRVECSNIVIMRWLVAVDDRGGLRALFKERTAHGPAGATAKYRFVDRVNELEEIDLINGNRTSVDEAFESAARRNVEEWENINRNNHRVITTLPKYLPPLPEKIFLLDTPAKLVQEGNEMSHCVGGYTKAVEKGDTLIFSVRAEGYRSTLEIVPRDESIEVQSHRGANNDSPPEPCVRAVEKYLED